MIAILVVSAAVMRQKTSKLLFHCHVTSFFYSNLNTPPTPHHPPEGRPGMSDVSPSFGISPFLAAVGLVLYLPLVSMAEN